MYKVKVDVEQIRFSGTVAGRTTWLFHTFSASVSGMAH